MMEISTATTSGFMSLIDTKDVVSNYLASLLFWVTTALLGAIVLHSKKRLVPLLANFFGPRWARWVYDSIRFVLNPWLRVLAIGLILLWGRFYGISDITFGSVFILCLTLAFQQKSIPQLDPTPDFTDSFGDKNHSTKNWIAKTNQVVIEDNFGKPQPDLLLKYIGTEATNSFLYLKEVESDYGVIEMDVYIEPGALFNFVFHADIEKHNWNMVRLDSRSGSTDGFLTKDGGAGNNWRYEVMSGTITPTKTWVKLRVEFDGNKVLAYKNGSLLFEKTKLKVYGKQIGLFNEVGDVHIDNFVFYKNNPNT